MAQLPVRWHARLLALPGVLTVLSVVAVLLGSHPQPHDAQPRLTAGTLSPALPELRPAPQPAPGVPLVPVPPPTPFRLANSPAHTAPLHPAQRAPRRQSDLSWWGRRQTDGG